MEICTLCSEYNGLVAKWLAFGGINTKAHHLISPLHTNTVSLAKYGTPFKSRFPPKPNPIIAALRLSECNNKEVFVLQGSPKLFTRLSIAITLGANPAVWTFPRHCLISAKTLVALSQGLKYLLVCPVFLTTPNGYCSHSSGGRASYGGGSSARATETSQRHCMENRLQRRLLHFSESVQGSSIQFRVLRRCFKFYSVIYYTFIPLLEFPLLFF
ncbi:hypothetical protein CDAR_534591 [Caerostris darwini]|uniref:Uncharacterized protein n=1 Tax=Caerostris darwini TaxID=1538125 RepID=A0AAV4MH21_9ARAC|nr:hypothetical protein CDAR_534591 [Caerostris darwini]